MPFCAGLDWIGSPFEDDERYLYGPSVAIIIDPERSYAEMAALRKELKMPGDREFRGHNSTEAMQAAVLKLALRLNAQFAVTLYDKRITQPGRERVTLPSPASFAAASALKTLETCAHKNPLARLWYDEGDISNKASQKAFHTAAQRIYRSYHPGNMLKVRPRPSHQSDLIQLADVAGYGFSRLARGLVEQPDLREILESIRADMRSSIRGPEGWET